jgi:hypothetical protein
LRRNAKCIRAVTQHGSKAPDRVTEACSCLLFTATEPNAFRKLAALVKLPRCLSEVREGDDRRRDRLGRAVRDFLDSRHGRHFADDVVSELAKAGPEHLEAAIEATIGRWQGWRIGRRTFRDEGIPAGLPYMTGWVTHFGILGETTG